MVPVTSVQAVFSGANVSPRACPSVPAGHGGCFQSEVFLTRPGHTQAFCLVLFSLSDVGLVALLCGVIRVVASDAGSSPGDGPLSAPGRVWARLHPLSCIGCLSLSN